MTHHNSVRPQCDSSELILITPTDFHVRKKAFPTNFEKKIFTFFRRTFYEIDFVPQKNFDNNLLRTRVILLRFPFSAARKTFFQLIFIQTKVN